MKGYMYILECSDGSYYVGSTNDIELRLQQHQNGEGSNHTKKRLPVKLVYYEEFQRIDEAFYREKQVQGWSRRKKEALIEGKFEKLPELSKNYTQLPSTSSGTRLSTGSGIPVVEPVETTIPKEAVKLINEVVVPNNVPSTSSGTGFSTGSGTSLSTSSGTDGTSVEPV